MCPDVFPLHQGLKLQDEAAEEEGLIPTAGDGAAEGGMADGGVVAKKKKKKKKKKAAISDEGGEGSAPVISDTQQC